MSNFSETLRSLMGLEELTQEEMERRSGIDRTVISRLARGLVLPDRKQLARLVAAISFDQARRVELLLAHLKDEAEAVHNQAGLDKRHYIIAPTSAAPSGSVLVPDDLFETVKLLIEEASRHEDTADILHNLAEMIRRHRYEIADSQSGKLYPLSGDKAELHAAEATAEEEKHIAAAMAEAQRKKTPAPPPQKIPEPLAPPPTPPEKAGSKAV